MSYQSKLNLRETETAIKALKDFFERALSFKGFQRLFFCCPKQALTII